MSNIYIQEPASQGKVTLLSAPVCVKGGMWKGKLCVFAVILSPILVPGLLSAFYFCSLVLLFLLSLFTNILVMYHLAFHFPMSIPDASFHFS